MKNLFLASVARNTLDRFVESFDYIPAKLKVAFVPTAGNGIQDNWFTAEDRNKLVELGFTVVDINLEGKTKKQLAEEMKGVDIVFVAGGNTFYLLQETIKSGFDEIVKDFVSNGGMYIGSSAGSLLAGPSIELAKNVDYQEQAPELKTHDGLGLVDFVVLPHYDDADFKDKIDQALQEYKNYRFKTVKITDSQAVMVKGDSVEIINK